jgi:hypothetical protein
MAGTFVVTSDDDCVTLMHIDRYLAVYSHIHAFIRYVDGRTIAKCY